MFGNPIKAGGVGLLRNCGLSLLIYAAQIVERHQKKKKKKKKKNTHTQMKQVLQLY